MRGRSSDTDEFVVVLVRKSVPRTEGVDSEGIGLGTERSRRFDIPSALKVDRIDEPWDVSDYKIPEPEEDAVQSIQNRTQCVSATREYPATFSIWSQLLIGIIVAKAIQLILENA